METVFLLLGSNVGDSQNYLVLAGREISRLGRVESTSSVYKTQPWGKTNQPDFLNQAIRLETHLSPRDLLAQLLEIELKLGRHRIEKWGPRIIDIDIIFYGHQIIETPSLTVPHPKMQDRRFVLVPLVEISPTFVHPVLKKSMAELLMQCQDQLEVNKVQTTLD